MFDTLHNLELLLIKELHTIRTPFLDGLMRALNLIDTAPAWTLLVLCILFFYHHTTGIRLLFLLLLSGIFNQDLKELFAQLRPSDLMPELGLIKLHSFGFPSGAAQTSVALFGFLAITIKKNWLFCVAIFSILIISFSRVYLGVHFPSDVFGGWIAGGILLATYLYVLPRVETYIAKSSKLTLYLLCGIELIALLILSITAEGKSIAIFGTGLSLGLLWAPSITTPKKWLKKYFRFLIAASGIATLVTLKTILPSSLILSWIFSLLCGLWIGFGVFYLSFKLKLN